MTFMLLTTIAGMVQSVTARTEPMMYPFLKIIDQGRKFIEKRRKEIKRLSCGCMVASGAVLPTLWPASLGLRGPYQV
jgi:hypothetical protein